MAIAVDASSPTTVTQTGRTTPLTTAAFSPPAASLLLARVGFGWTGQAVALTLSDSGTHTWTQAVSIVGSPVPTGGIAAIYYCYLASAPGSITVSMANDDLVGTDGGQMLAVDVLTGCASSQSAGAKASAANGAVTTGTLSITTTAAGSKVYGVGDDSNSGATWTANGSTTGDFTFTDTTDGITLVAWRATALTGTPGATTLGGTWGVAEQNNQVAFEVLPAAGAAAAIPNKQLIIPQAINRSYFF